MVSRCLSAAGVRFLVILCPPGNSASLTVGLPDLSPDPDGVSTFRTHELRPRWVPSIPRGRRCSPGLATITSPRPLLPSSKSLHPATTIDPCEAPLYEASTSVQALRGWGERAGRGACSELASDRGKAVVRPASPRLSLLKDPALCAAVRALPHPRRVSHLAEPVLASADFCSGSPTSRSSSADLVPAGATKQNPRRAPWRQSSRSDLGDRSSTGLGASMGFFAALGGTSTPGVDSCFDQIVSKERLRWPAVAGVALCAGRHRRRPRNSALRSA